jgi:hypothetical protein
MGACREKQVFRAVIFVKCYRPSIQTDKWERSTEGRESKPGGERS